ncbi:dystrophin isoform X2 [Dunckerocampus dactyliophorus]|nr:dystrophin isoform X2 [Dunckerocampus dactyliophorus]
MALLEELSGCKLLYRFRSSTHRMLRLSNISKALAFLDERHVKLLGIDAPGIADGIPSVVLPLIWTIILHFQVKQVTAGHLFPSQPSVSVSSYLSSSDLDNAGSYSSNTLPSKPKNATKEPKYKRKAIERLLLLVQRCTSKFGIEVHDFGKSWRSGLAFQAIIKSRNPTLVNMTESLSMEPRECIQRAFTIARRHLRIPSLLDPEDVACISPDEQSIITYVSMLMGCHSLIDKDHTADMEESVPWIPNLRSAVNAETTVGDLSAHCVEKSSEQDLWERWTTTSFGSSCDNSSSHYRRSSTKHPEGASQVSGKKVGQASEPPSPLKAGGISQEIRSWMEKGCSKAKRDEGHFSMSSEEGIYSLSALDSEEEDAHSRNVDINKDVFHSYALFRREVARVEEETFEEMMLNGEKSQHLKAPIEEGNDDGDDESGEGKVGKYTSVKRKAGQWKTEECGRMKDDTRSQISVGGFFPQSSPASCDTTPLELKMLLLLWILLYCCLIVPQMNL